MKMNAEERSERAIVRSSNDTVWGWVNRNDIVFVMSSSLGEMEMIRFS